MVAVTQTCTVRPRSRGSPPPRGKRDDIQGLRAVAIISVVAYHSGLPHVTGGFIGVDLFFVLSGFLITQLLLREVAATGAVDLRRFWARRARRIIPASALVLIITMLAVREFISPIERGPIGLDAVWSTLFAGNWRFARQETDYLAADRDPSPLLHYWSLGVEEQFYLIWPLLLLTLAAGLRLSRQHRAGYALAFGGVFTAVIVVSLAYCIHATTTNQPYAFFGTPARAWQLAAGALTALAVPAITGWRPRIREALGASGLVLFGVSVYVLEESGSAGLLYPSWLALAPTLAGVLLIVSGTGSYSRLNRMFSIRPLTYVGDLSYSLYLWHWPVLIIGVEALDTDTPPARLSLVMLAFVLSVASFHLVEDPIRRARFLARRPTFSLAAGALLLGTVLPAIAYASQTRAPDTVVAPRPPVARDDSTPESRPDPLPTSPTKVRPPLEKAFDDALPLTDRGCHVGYGVVTAPRWDACTFANRGADKGVVVVGDSISGAIAPGVIAAGERHGWAVTVWAKSRCPMADVTRFDAGRGGPYEECDDFREAVLRRIEQRGPDVVVLAMSRGSTDALAVDGKQTGGAEAVDRAIDGLARTVNRLRIAGIGVVLTDSPHRAPFLPTGCLAKERDVRECTFEPNRPVSIMQMTAQQMRDAVSLVEPNQRVCRENICYPVVGDVVVYRDKIHFTETFARTLAEEFTAGIVQAAPSMSGGQVG